MNLVQVRHALSDIHNCETVTARCAKATHALKPVKDRFLLCSKSPTGFRRPRPLFTSTFIFRFVVHSDFYKV